MKSRIELAVDRKHNGYNCAQAVACTYCDLANVDEQTAAVITQPLGSGMGSMDGTCGAVTGACIVAGLINKDSGRMEVMQNSRYIISRFTEKNTTSVCKMLKGVDTGKVIRSCDDCVRDAAELLENILMKGDVE